MPSRSVGQTIPSFAAPSFESSNATCLKSGCVSEIPATIACRDWLSASRSAVVSGLDRIRPVTFSKVASSCSTCPANVWAMMPPNPRTPSNAWLSSSELIPAAKRAASRRSNLKRAYGGVADHLSSAIWKPGRDVASISSNTALYPDCIRTDRSVWPSTVSSAHQAVERVEEGSAAPPCQCRWAARVDAGFTQMLLESSASQGPSMSWKVHSLPL
jgi:hypothetical protein